ncbi:MAG: threonine--tRNA ligase [bacterium]|jgi:threonyl-tRNA synthetase|nr:threonine--tRNA ligase [Bacillota bacterium]
MDKIVISLPDGSQLEYPRGVEVAQVARDISPRLYKDAVAAKVNGRLVDLATPLEEDSELEVLTFASEEGQRVFRHTSSHILAQAVKRLYPEAKFAIGPAIENGFYYDFDVPESFTPQDLEKIEAEMKKIVAADYPIVREEVSREEALAFFAEQGEKYKEELIRDLPEDVQVSLYRQGEFVDLCAGPHAPSTGKIKAIKLTSVAGAYWRGDENREMLQRIYGTSFPKQKELDEHLKMLEEAAKRDHRKLGRELDLFSIHEEGPGFPFFHPKGMIIRNELESFWREVHTRWGYQEIKTPIILREDLWKQSGHWDHYKENMYFTEIDEQAYAIKPMNCPGGILVYKNRPHSYREFPLRMAELGLVHRHELSGVLHGLMRVRSFTQDDAHIFLLPEQIKDEIINVIELTDYLYRVFGFDYHVELSTKPEKAMGSEEDWENATQALREALEEKGIEYKVNEGDGAFYGPKIDFHLKDCLGRTWQCGTIQLDFQMPERFELEYTGEDGEKHRPVMIHRTCLGSIERFIGILIEHYAGAFPTWLAPVQVKILPITDRHLDYCRQLAEEYKEHGIRVEVDERNEKVGYKIREAQLNKIPYMLIVGDKEVEEGTVSVRARSQGDIGAMAADRFLELIKEEIEVKASS